MVKHTQTISRQQSTNCLSVFDHFVGLVVKIKGSKYKQKKLLRRPSFQVNIGLILFEKKLEHIFHFEKYPDTNLRRQKEYSDLAEVRFPFLHGPGLLVLLALAKTKCFNCKDMVKSTKHKFF